MRKKVEILMEMLQNPDKLIYIEKSSTIALEIYAVIQCSITLVLYLFGHQTLKLHGFWHL
jgi:hypothetical protein